MKNEIDALDFLDMLIEGEMTDIKTTFLSAVENDKRNIRVQTASKIAAA